MIAFGVICSCVGAASLVARRARVGARVRATAGVRLRITDRLAPMISGAAARRGALGFLGGMVFAGTATAALGLAAGVASEPFSRARAQRRIARTMTGQIPDMLRSLAAALRAGRSLPQALEAARDEAPAPLLNALDASVRRLDVGAPLDEVLDVFAKRAASPEAATVVETLKIGRAAGSNLPAMLDVAVESLAERERIARDRRATSVQARMSAAVVGLMPVAFFVLIGSGARDQMHVLFGGPVGWGLLAAGLGLEAGGALWMRALVRVR